ncbi:protein YifE [Escherichia coli]|uniref:Macrodomain Ori protein n=1 Tax=Escherichia coli TaxID=562 RepID=A0A376VT61_ECOLX|nr:protein YifE [Escherichia coli]
MAESFTTTNRYFDNKHYPRGFSRHGDFTIKEAQLLSVMVMPSMSWILANASRLPRKRNSS